MHVGSASAEGDPDADVETGEEEADEAVEAPTHHQSISLPSGVKETDAQTCKSGRRVRIYQ